MQLHDSLSITISLAVSQPKVKPDHNSHHQLVFNRVANPPNQSQMLLSRAAWYNCFNFPRPTPKQLKKQLNTNALAKSSNHRSESHDHCFALPNSHINRTKKRLQRFGFLSRRLDWALAWTVCKGRLQQNQRSNPELQLHNSFNITKLLAVSQQKVNPDHNNHHHFVQQSCQPTTPKSDATFKSSMV